MILTEAADPPTVATVAEACAVLRTMAGDGLPAGLDGAEVGKRFEAALLGRGLDLSDAGCWLLWHLAEPSGGEDDGVAAMRWAVDVHACVPRRHDDPIAALDHGLRLVRRYLRPSPAMETYLADRARELAALHVRRARAQVDGESLGRLLPHALSMDDADTVRLPFSVTLPASEAFECLREDGIALHRFGIRMCADPTYRIALGRHRDLVSAGVERGLHRLFEHPGLGGIVPTAYVDHLRCALGDGRWIDNILAHLRSEAGHSRSGRTEADAAGWVVALSTLGGWNSKRLNALLKRADLFADHPDAFMSTALNAIEHVARRDAAAEVHAALTLLSMVRTRTDGVRDHQASDMARRCRKRIAGLRRGHDLLWLHDRLDPMSGAPPKGPTEAKPWPASVSIRVAGDRALAWGTLRFLMAKRDERIFLRATPLAEGVLSLRVEFRRLWKLAHDEDEVVGRRAGMFMMGILGGRIRRPARFGTPRATV